MNINDKVEHNKEIKNDKKHPEHHIKHQAGDAAEQNQWKKHPGGG